MTSKPPKTAAGGGSEAGPPRPNPVAAYFRALWSGREPLHRIVISDMLIGGTLINVVAMGAAFGLFGIGVPLLATVAFFSPAPYNIFLVLCVWRTADAARPAWAWPARILALVWLTIMLFI